MSQLAPRAASARFFGLDMGDWSVLVGGFALAGLILFLTYPVAPVGAIAGLAQGEEPGQPGDDPGAGSGVVTLVTSALP